MSHLGFSSQTAFCAKKYALLIGIDDYSLSTGFKNLTGVRNDIDIMKNVLKDSRFDFTDIKVLYNEEATHSRIKKEFTSIAAFCNTSEKPFVYIYFSGHGSLTRDLNGDEQKLKDLKGNDIPSYDQTWVSWGSRLKKGITPPDGFTDIDYYDILDDEISIWLNNIASNCEQLVFVSDSCHSGSVARSGILSGIRRGQIDVRKHPLGKNTYQKNTQKNIIMIGASADNQIAREYLPTGSNQIYGIFTWSWAQSMLKCYPTDSWSHLFNRVSRIVYQESQHRQNPQISGAISRKVFSNDLLMPSQAISVYEVLNIKGKKQISLAAGQILGITKGSVYTLEGKEKDPNPPQIIITEVKPYKSLAITEADVNVYDQVVEISHHHAFFPILLFLKAEHEADRKKPLEDIRAALKQLKPYKITNDKTSCNFIVYLFRSCKSSNQENFDHAVPPLSKPEGNIKIWILDKNGYLYDKNLRHSYSKKGIATLTKNLYKLARMKDMMQITSPEKTSPLKITVTPMVPSYQKGNRDSVYIENQWFTKICNSGKYKILEPILLSDFLGKKWDLCTMIRFNAENPTKTPYYFYVISVDRQGEITPIFPALTESSQIAIVPPGAKSNTGKALIRLDTRTLDHYKIIVCKKPINHQLFFQPGFNLALRAGNNTSSLNPLEKILLNTVTGMRSSVSYKTGSWYAETITIDMRDF